MTTIAYRYGVLAADTLGTRANIRDSFGVKIVSRNGLLAGACGSANHNKRFRDWFLTGCPGGHPHMGNADGVWGMGFIILPDDSIVTFSPDGMGLDPRLLEGCQAWGSGAELAMGAMLAGASPARAVALAAIVDVNTGGEITVLRRS